MNQTFLDLRHQVSYASFSAAYPAKNKSACDDVSHDLNLAAASPIDSCFFT